MLRQANKDIGALANNKPHNFAASHALTYFQGGVICSFIPKNGCSTLRLSLAIANGCAAGPEDVTWIHANNATFSASLRDLATARYTFVVLRCPFSRLASVFLDKILSRQAEYWKLNRFENDQLNPDTLTFREFVKLVGVSGRIRSNVHWRPQVDFLVYENYDSYFAFEDFGAAIKEIEKKAGFSVVDARPLTRHGTDRVELDTGDCFSDTPLSALETMRRDGRLPAHANLYDTALVNEALKLYAADITFYKSKFGASGLMFSDVVKKD